MKYLFPVLAAALLLTGCAKETDGGQVEIYLLKSFTVKMDTTYYPSVTVVSNPVPESKPLVSNNEIKNYTQSTNTFQLSTNIHDRVKDLGPDKAFVVMANNQPVYFGVIHPAYLSSLRFGIATLDPILTNTELTIRYIYMTGPGNYTFLQQMDKRNDPALLSALRLSGRLK